MAQTICEEINPGHLTYIIISKTSLYKHTHTHTHISKLVQFTNVLNSDIKKHDTALGRYRHLVIVVFSVYLCRIQVKLNRSAAILGYMLTVNLYTTNTRVNIYTATLVCLPTPSHFIIRIQEGLKTAHVLESVKSFQIHILL